MPSIRRMLSPVPRAGTSMNGEACQVPSPLSKSSSSNQNNPASGGLLSSLFRPSDSQAFVLSVSSPRSSSPLERSKPRGPVWRKPLFHFLVCFMVGLFIGLTPFVSMNISTNLLSRHQAFSFEVVSTAGNFHTYEGMARNTSPVVEVEDVKNNSTMELQGVNRESFDGISNNASFSYSLNDDLDFTSRKLLIILTPTQVRPFQAYYLSHLAYTLKLVQPPLLWIVVEMTSQSDQTADILRRSGVMNRHLVCVKNITGIKDRRVHQRNVALSHIETHHLDGIVYFADDDNIYSVGLFEQIRQIRRFGTWMVANVNKGNVLLEGPICNGTQVIGWHINNLRMRFRRFHAAMSGFAFNSTILWDPKRWHRPTPEPIRQLDTVRDGFQASAFIEQVVEDESQMEGLPEGCSRVMAWHRHHESFNLFYPPKWFVNNNLDVTTQFW